MQALHTYALRTENCSYNISNENNLHHVNCFYGKLISLGPVGTRTHKYQGTSLHFSQGSLKNLERGQVLTHFSLTRAPPDLVPTYINDIKSKASQPSVVPLGPFHHGDPNLPMEEHKRRAMRYLLCRHG